MNKREFIEALNARTGALPQAEQERLAAYYTEIIEDAVEDGFPEEEVVAALGDVDALVRELTPAAGTRDFTESAEHADALREICLRVQDADISIAHAPLDNGAAAQFKVSEPGAFRWLTRDGVLEITEIRGPRSERSRARQHSVSVTIANVAPQRISVETRGGDICLEGISADELISLSTGSGDARLSRCACGGGFSLTSRSGDFEAAGLQMEGDVRINTASGDVDLKNAAVGGELRVECSSGDIALRNIQADRLYLKALAGDVETDRAQVSFAEARTVSGDVRLDEIEKARGLSVETVSGDIEVTRCDCVDMALIAVSGDIDARLINYPGGLSINANTRAGRIHLPRKWTSPEGNGEKRRVNARTVSGDIEVTISE